MKKRILIVEDSSFIREILKHICIKEGWETKEAQDGSYALESVERWFPDAILMDLVMPHLSGLEASKKILKEFPDIPIVAISTLSDEAIIAEAIEIGCVSYIKKPFEHQDITRALNEVFENQRRKCG